MLAFTRHLTADAAAVPAAAPTPSSPPAPLVVFGIDPDVSGALAVVAVQEREGNDSSSALRAALAAWEEAAATPEAASSAATAAASATAAAARASFALVSVHDTPIEKVAVGKSLRSRPDPAAVVALVAAASAAARARLGEDAATPSSLLAVIERPAPGFNNGRLSWLATGFAYGVWRAALAASGVPVLSVPASAWKKDLGLLRQGKDASRELAGAWLSAEEAGEESGRASSSSSSSEEEDGESSAPSGSALTAKGGLLGRKRDHGRAEAALIALWGAAIGRAGVGGRVECEGVATGPVETATPGLPGRRKAAAPASTPSSAGAGRRAAVAAAGAAANSAPSGRRAASTKAAAAPKAKPRGPSALKEG